MKAKDMVFKLKSNLFQKFHRQYCKDGDEKNITTHSWSKVDIQFCDPLYIPTNFDLFYMF